MRDSLTVLITILLIGFIVAPLSVNAQEPDPVATWLALVNKARLDNSLAPYGLSRRLTAAAQRHAIDLAANGFTNADDVHVGSDGSTPAQRVAELGYAAWILDPPGSLVEESVWTGVIADGMAFFLEEPVVRDKILSAAYREIGIGAAASADGRNYYVLVFGVHPNILPVFINYGAVSTDSSQVAILLTNETVRPEGQGMNFMGQAIEFRISNAPNLDDIPWQPWEQLIPWTLPTAPGEHIVYVQFRDAAGRTAAATAAIFLSETPVTPTPVLPNLTVEPAAFPDPTTTPLPDLFSTANAMPGSSPPDTTPIPFPTWTPLPSVTPQKEVANQPTDAPLVTLAALQALALILGLYLFLQRRREH